MSSQMIERYKKGFYEYAGVDATDQIVCVGMGRAFPYYLDILARRKVSRKIVALIDNDEKKQGNKKEIDGRVLTIRGFDYLKKMAMDNEDFIILIMTEAKHHNSILQQLASMHISDKVYIGFPDNLLDERFQRVTTCSNLFRYMNMGIGDNGKNMTISILAHDRAELTIRLLDSIRRKLPDFQGELLIGDNKSAGDELFAVKEWLRNCDLKWRILEFDKHYPIPQGKNLLNKEVKTDWIMQLDNDTYFTADPMEKINADMKELGCPIWGLPCFDTQYQKVVNYGSHLDFQQDDNGLKLRCCVDLQFYQTEERWDPMLCTYAAGGLSLFQKKLFEDLQGYDENLYMFEDIDFMYRANMRGYKVGNVGMVSLVHDHKKIGSKRGKEYEAVRFDVDRVRKSETYLWEKYGFAVR